MKQLNLTALYRISGGLAGHQFKERKKYSTNI
jgi:hypothetical protein